MISPGSLLQSEWFRSHEAQEIIVQLFHRDGYTSKTFGLLEHPRYLQMKSSEEVSYKVFLVGKSNVGKTSTVSKLSGNSIPTSHSETPGVQISTMYWPAKVSKLNTVILFKLCLWDAGEYSMKKFDHILNACTENADGILFLFSFIDKGSFEELPQYLAKLTNPYDDLCKIVLGTKFDQHSQSEVTQRDIKEFESNWNVPVLRIKNVPSCNESDSQNEFCQLVPILNTVCEHLWHRDFILAQKRTSSHQEKAFF